MVFISPHILWQRLQKNAGKNHSGNLWTGNDHLFQETRTVAPSEQDSPMKGSQKGFWKRRQAFHMISNPAQIVASPAIFCKDIPSLNRTSDIRTITTMLAAESTG